MINTRNSVDQCYETSIIKMYSLNLKSVILEAHSKGVITSLLDIFEGNLYFSIKDTNVKANV